MLKEIGHGSLRKSQRDLVLGQLPHHSPSQNHYPAFWRSRNYEEGKATRYLRGTNPYGHPDANAVSELIELGYVISTTGEEEKPSHSENEMALDLISTDVTPKSGNQDLIYEIAGPGAAKRL